MNTNEIIAEAKATMNREYDWIRESLSRCHHEAQVAGVFDDTKFRELRAFAEFFKGELREGGEFSTEFFHVMEELKAVVGDMFAYARGERLDPKIEKLCREEREGFGFRY